jgi:hypothetical protein
MRRQKANGKKLKAEMLKAERGGEGEALTLKELQARGVVGLTKVQMATALQVCPRTITEMMRRGEISFFKIGKKLVRFRVEEALARMSERVLVVADDGRGE